MECDAWNAVHGDWWRVECAPLLDPEGVDIGVAMVLPWLWPVDTSSVEDLRGCVAAMGHYASRTASCRRGGGAGT